MDEEKITDFLKTAIADTQGTIRALDTKIGVLIAILVFPLANVNKIVSNIHNLFARNIGCYILILLALVLIFCVLWIFSFLTAIRGVVGIDNPMVHIKPSKLKTNGYFYLGGAYKFGSEDILINRQSKQSNLSSEELMAALKDPNTSINNELAFEKLKLTYIRDVKMYRHKVSAILAIFWLTSGLAIYLIGFSLRIYSF